MSLFRDKSTGDQLILVVCCTVCITVLASGLFVAVLSLFRPAVDVTLWVSRVTAVVNTMIGLMAGYLAGRTTNGHDKPDTPTKEQQQ